MISFLKRFGEVIVSSNLRETKGYSPWFDFGNQKKVRKKRIPSERASQEEQNGVNFSSIAPSSEEL